MNEWFPSCPSPPSTSDDERRDVNDSTHRDVIARSIDEDDEDDDDAFGRRTRRDEADADDEEDDARARVTERF